MIEYQELTYSEYEGIAILVSGGKALKHNVSRSIVGDTVAMFADQAAGDWTRLN